MAWKLKLPQLLLRKKQYSPTLPGGTNWFWPVVREPFTGAWQRNIELRTENILAFHAVYACLERIASDVAKCRLRLVEQNDSGIWNEVTVPAFTPVIRKPNNYQNRIQFFESWMLSKLMSGNAYILKERDERNVVVRLYVLDPTYVKPLVAPDGSVFYELSKDNLAGIDDRLIVPASEIVHDMMTMKHHHLCGLSPMAPASLAAVHGINIQRMSTDFFSNAAKPSGVLSAPAEIPQAVVDRLTNYFETKFTGPNSGKLAILGSGLKFEKMTMDFVDAQMIEQLKISATMVCASFGVPPHMVHVGDPPSYNNIESLNQQYYSQTLQKYFESIELCLDEGLGLTEVSGKTYGTWFDLDDLLRMDTATLVETEAKLVGAGIKAPDESRARFNFGPAKGGGGESPLMQQQNFSLAALAKRDAQDDPFSSNKPPTPAASSPPETPPPVRSLDVDDPDELAAITTLANWELRRFLATA
jgi:HK97 family phage portal protein